MGAHLGGPSTCTYDLLTAMHGIGCDVDLLTLSSPDIIGSGETWIKALPDDAIGPYCYSRNISRWLRQSDYDIYHTNGLWLYCNHDTCAAARHKRSPYIITPHGMLYPAALRRSYWKKWPLIQLCFRKDIELADCIHVTCKPEMEHVRSFGYGGPVAVIPNPGNLPNYLDEIWNARCAAVEGRRVFGFLGRLHPVKSIESLLYGMALLPKERDCRLVVMGKGDDAYEQFIRSEVTRLGLGDKVEFKGFISGRAKLEELSRFSCLFVPSDFENFGMIVTEALSVGTPVMASLGTPWEELNSKKCGWWIDRSPENIARVMQQVLEMPQADLFAMGERGRQLVLEKYTANRVARQMLALYEWILNGGAKPDFVYE